VSKQGKLYAENNLGLKAIGDHQARCKSAVFLQTERDNAPVFPQTKTDGFAGLSGSGPNAVEGNGARFGLGLGVKDVM
jgi:hypothetical protein